MIVIALCVLCAAPVAGCRGCRFWRTAEEIEAEKKKQIKVKPKDPFEYGQTVARPADDRATAEGRSIPGLALKPNHWTSVNLEQVKANDEDFQGRLEAQSVASATTQQPLPLPGLPYTFQTQRSASLPKGQVKQLETAVLHPYQRTNGSVDLQLVRRGGRVELPIFTPPLLMPSYQYHFVVLAKLPSGYKYLEAMTAIDLRNTWTEGGRPFYRVALIAPKQARWALPSHALQWTSTAVVLWDDFDPQQIEPPQQQALVDWLHWGGQLIVSGPGSLDGLKGSFLEPYLAATSGGPQPLAAEAFEPLNTWWNKPDLPRLIPARALSGVKLALNPHLESRFVPALGELVAEARVGRGRVVVTAFRLATREVATWPGYDSFFNACLLTHPPRRRTVSSDGVEGVNFAEGECFDAAITTNLRYFTRDTGRSLSDYGDDVLQMRAESGLLPPAAPGIAAWDDFGPVPAAARRSLVNASRIEIPKRGFIVVILAAYLFFLVPVNAAIFWVLDRLEWAWIAAPIIALLCTLTVIRGAQLDIGFARARNEIAVLEIKADSPRAHLTRYISLYTSLTTQYLIQSDDPGAILLPFSRAARADAFTMPYTAGYLPLVCRRGADTEVQGVGVSSNDYGLLHCEHLVTLPGPLQLTEHADGGQELVNQTGLALRGVGVLRRSPGGKLQVAWLGRLESNQPVHLVWDWDAPQATGAALWGEERARDALTAAVAGPGELSIRGLAELAQEAEGFLPGQVRLVAWTNDALPGLTITPSSAQNRQATLIVADLRAGFAAAYPPDAKYIPRLRRSEIDTQWLDDAPADAAADDKSPQ